MLAARSQGCVLDRTEMRSFAREFCCSGLEALGSPCCAGDLYFCNIFHIVLLVVAAGAQGKAFSFWGGGGS